MHSNYIFDFDYTLYTTSETVMVWSPKGDSVFNGRTCFHLLPAEFSTYNLCDGDTIDEDSFLNFYNIDFQNATPIYPVVEWYNLVQNKVILSARPQNAANDFYKKHGNSVEFIGLKNSCPKAKIEVIKYYKDVLVFEDSWRVIEECIINKIDCVFVKLDSNNNTQLKYYYNPR